MAYMANSLIKDEDYYINELGLYVFTEKYHLKRGYCCQNGCKHCPYDFKNVKKAGKTPYTQKKD